MESLNTPFPLALLSHEPRCRFHLSSIPNILHSNGFRSVPGMKIILGDIDAIDDGCSLWEQTFFSCSLYMPNIIGSSGHLQSSLASLTKAFGLD